MTPTEKVINDAEIASAYFRTLIANGLTVSAAMSITSSYAGYRLIAGANKEKPRDPWDPPA